MRRIAVIGPDSSSGVLNTGAFVRQLAERLGVEAFALPAQPGFEFAAAIAPYALATPDRGGAAPVVQVDADTVIWLHFGPGLYLRDWVAGWFDVLLNGARGARRRAQRASLGTALRALVTGRRELRPDQIDNLRRHVRLIELTSPAQVRFWLKLQEERVRTLPIRFESR